MNIAKLEKELKEKCTVNDLDKFISNFRNYLLKKYYRVNKLEIYKLRFISDKNTIYIIRNNNIVGYINIYMTEENKLQTYLIKIFDEVSEKCTSYKTIIKKLDEYLIKVQRIDK